MEPFQSVKGKLLGFYPLGTMNVGTSKSTTVNSEGDNNAKSSQ